MKTTLMVLIAAGAVVVGGCATPRKTATSAGTAGPPVERQTARMVAGTKAEQTEQVKQCLVRWRQEGWSVLSVSAPVTQPDGKIHWSAQLERPAAADGNGVPYDDQRIAMIKRGQTTAEQLVAWFGPPESRAVVGDGQGRLAWKFTCRTAQGVGTAGTLEVALSPEGTVVAYSARRGPDWSAGSGHPAESSAGYDDQRIAMIKRGETTAQQLVTWFGPAESRSVNGDGRAQLTWGFAGHTHGGAGHSGTLEVSLSPEDTVVAYSARRGTQ